MARTDLEEQLSLNLPSQIVGKSPLERAYKALSGKVDLYTDLWNYYDGDQPLMYTSKRLEDVFKDLDVSFVENWCSVVIDSANDRIDLSTMQVGNDKLQKLLNLWWDELNLGLEANDVHEAAQVIGEAFLMIWKDEEDDLPQVFYNDPRLVHLFYRDDNPRKKEFAAKWWVDHEGFIRMTLYFEDQIEYYRSNKKEQAVSSYQNFDPFNPSEEEGGEVVKNPFDEVPWFHFRLERRKIKSDLANVIPLQNGVNKLLTDMMVAAEFGAFRQRWIISNADTSQLQNAPNEIWEVPAGDGQGQGSSVGQFDATDLSNYISAIDHLANSAATISRTPKHYLFEAGGDPSGEALIAMEAPLNKRVQDHIERFTPVWREAVQFMFKVMGKDVDRQIITPTFSPVETVQPKTEAEVRKTSVDAGLPLKTVLREEGKDDAWLKQLDEDMEEETERKAASFASMMVDRERQFNAGGSSNNLPTDDESDEEEE